MGIRKGSGATIVALAPAAAFAYLADPRHAPEWFAGVGVAELPEGSPREGMSWRFERAGGHARGQRVAAGRGTPVRMSAYEYPARFVWRTAHEWPRTNLAWELRCEPVQGAGAAVEAGEDRRSQNAPTDLPGLHTRLIFTIRIEPGPLGWLTLLLAAPFSRGTLSARAQRAVDRARAALEEQRAAGERRQGHAPRRPKATRKGRAPGRR